MKSHKIYAEHLEQNVLDQFYGALEQDYVIKGALMADAHLGYSLPIGGVIATKDVIVPSWIGFDIGCGCSAVKMMVHKDEVDAGKIFKKIYETIPVGFNHNKKPDEWFDIKDYKISDTLKTIFKERNGLHQIGTLGGGNHFIEIGYDEDNYVWIVIHSGSRGIGHAVATHYMRLASGDGKAREGHYGLKTDSATGKEYIMDMNFCLEFAIENRSIMIGKVLDIFENQVGVQIIDIPWDTINRNHNHAELKDGLWIHRKGATHADKDMMGVIPGNMKDGSFIVKGKGDPDSLNSSSHGAGRRMSRKEAKRQIDINAFEATMQGITAKVDLDTLDEAPGAYKDIYKVMDTQKDLIDVVSHIKPIINVKG